MNFLKRLFRGTRSAVTNVAVIGVFAKIILFDIIWASHTTFTSFSYPETYVNAFLAALVFAFPFACFGSKWLQAVVMFVLDGLLVSNLMYSRTYFVSIPFDSYFLAGNLADFTASIYDAVRLIDVLLPLSTLATIIAINRTATQKAALRPYFVSVIGVFLISSGVNMIKGGFQNAMLSLQNANRHSCNVPMYTIFGTICYELMQESEEYSPEIAEGIKTWLARQPEYKPLADNISGRQNIVIILCESLESWALECKVEGIELTPNLNVLLKDSTTLYAPYVLSQAAGGRSIDGQLLINTGLLPVANGSYSTKYPSHTYPSIVKALKEKYGSTGYLMTVDKPIVWNQGSVANNFGIDTILSRSSWVNDERVGPRKKLGDNSFFRQIVEKLNNKEIWQPGEPAYVQCVTYTGHNPFVLPENLRKISFEGDYPQLMEDYMITVNYTDAAIAQFVNYLKSRPDYDKTIVVISGDHEGLAEQRRDISSSAAGRGIVSDKQFVPFIVLNSPIGMRYEHVMGQIDIYPTLLNILKLDDYAWKGLGQSILDPEKPRFAIGPQANLEGDTTSVAAERYAHIFGSWKISDQLIRYDYFAR